MNSNDIAIKKAIEYIENNLNKHLELNEIAKIASYSPYHFSRIFKQATGENLLTMIKRLRLSQSTRKLLYEKETITTIGLDIGYETASSFNKAFKQMFGMSPTEYKNLTSKNLKKFSEKQSIEPQIIELEKPIYTIYSRALGEYGEGAVIAWQNLFKKIDNKNIEFNNKRYFGLCYDNPKITDYKKMRYEACLSLNRDEIVSNKSLLEIPKGKYAKLIYKGAYDDLYDIWFNFYAWIYNNNFLLENTPPIEEYLDTPKEILKNKASKYTTYLMLKLK